jgi:hypothetical protein
MEGRILTEIMKWDVRSYCKVVNVPAVQFTAVIQDTRQILQGIVCSISTHLISSHLISAPLPPLDLGGYVRCTVAITFAIPMEHSQERRLPTDQCLDRVCLHAKYLNSLSMESWMLRCNATSLVTSVARLLQLTLATFPQSICLRCRASW